MGEIKAQSKVGKTVYGYLHTGTLTAEIKKERPWLLPTGPQDFKGH